MTAVAAPPRLSPGQKIQLGLEIVVAYARVRRALRRVTLPDVVARIRGPAPARWRWRLRGPADAGRLAGAVIRTTRVLPSGSRCLVRSLVLLDVLSRRGIDGALVIAVQPGEATDLDAHAWVEVDGRPLLPPAPGFGRLLTL